MSKWDEKIMSKIGRHRRCLRFSDYYKPLSSEDARSIHDLLLMRNVSSIMRGIISINKRMIMKTVMAANLERKERKELKRLKAKYEVG